MRFWLLFTVFCACVFWKSCFFLGNNNVGCDSDCYLQCLVRVSFGENMDARNHENSSRNHGARCYFSNMLGNSSNLMRFPFHAVFIRWFAWCFQEPSRDGFSLILDLILELPGKIVQDFGGDLRSTGTSWGQLRLWRAIPKTAINSPCFQGIPPAISWQREKTGNSKKGHKFPLFSRYFPGHFLAEGKNKHLANSL